MGNFVQIQNQSPSASYLFGQGLSKALDQQIQQQQQAKVWQAIADMAQKLYTQQPGGTTATPSSQTTTPQTQPTTNATETVKATPQTVVPDSTGIAAKDLAQAVSTTPSVVQLLGQKISRQESSDNPSSYNKDSGAFGQFQFMPETWSAKAKEAGVDPSDTSPESQKKVADFYMTQLYNKYQDPKLVAAAWYAGEGYADSLKNGKPLYDPDVRMGANGYLDPNGPYPSVNEYIKQTLGQDVGDGPAVIPQQKPQNQGLAIVYPGQQPTAAATTAPQPASFNPDSVAKTMSGIQGTNLTGMYQALAKVASMPGVDMKVAGPLVQQMFGQKMEAELGAQRAKFLSSALDDLNNDGVGGKPDMKKAVRYMTILENLGFKLDTKAFSEAYKDPDLDIHPLDLNGSKYIVSMNKKTGQVVSIVGGETSLSQKDILNSNTTIKAHQITAESNNRNEDVRSKTQLDIAKLNNERFQNGGMTKQQAEAKAAAYGKLREQIKNEILGAKTSDEVQQALKKMDVLKEQYAPFKDALTAQGINLDFDHYEMNTTYGRDRMRALNPKMTFQPYE